MCFPKKCSGVLATALICSLAIAADAQAQLPPRDDVLLLVPADQIEGVTGVRIYQRLPDAFVVGAEHHAAVRLQRRGLEPLTLDASPWTQGYVYLVVEELPVAAGRGGFSGLPVRILHRRNDLMIVKTTPETAAALRERGFSCVEIERRVIPVQWGKTHLPHSLSAERSNDIAPILALVSDSMITSYIQQMQDFGTRHWSRPNRDSVFNWVRDAFMDAGVADVKLDSFIYSSTLQKNVVATISGTIYPGSEIIIGGHFDSYNSANQNAAPGADDNASGTAAALEMARVLRSINYQPAFTLRFIGFAAEEAGLRGSASYALRARQANHDIRIMQNYDMIGYRNQSQTDRDFSIVWYPGSEAFSNLHAATATTYTTLTPVFTTSYRSSSDSWSFYQQNYKTLFCIERDFSPYYHSANDLLIHLDIPYAREIIQAGLAMLLTLDKLPPEIVNLRLRDRGDGATLFAQWDPTPALDFMHYKVYAGSAPGVYDTSFTQTGTSRFVGGLVQGSPAYIGVSVVDLLGREGVIVEQHAVPNLIPAPPTGLWAVNHGTGALLTWERNPEMDIAGYNMYRRRDDQPAAIKLNTTTITDTAWIDTTEIRHVYFYCITAVDSAGYESAPSDSLPFGPVVGVGDDRRTTPFAFRLYQNYPNPFNPSTTIEFSLPPSAAPLSATSLRVYDVPGREVAVLVNEQLPAGRHVVVWNPEGLAGGVYFYTLRSGGMVETRRMVIVQ
jgi:hypothetical protein